MCFSKFVFLKVRIFSKECFLDLYCIFTFQMEVNVKLFSTKIITVGSGGKNVILTR